MGDLGVELRVLRVWRRLRGIAVGAVLEVVVGGQPDVVRVVELARPVTWAQSRARARTRAGRTRSRRRSRCERTSDVVAVGLGGVVEQPRIGGRDVRVDERDQLLGAGLVRNVPVGRCGRVRHALVAEGGDCGLERLRVRVHAIGEGLGVMGLVVSKEDVIARADHRAPHLGAPCAREAPHELDVKGRDEQATVVEVGPPRASRRDAVTSSRPELDEGTRSPARVSLVGGEPDAQIARRCGDRARAPRSNAARGSVPRRRIGDQARAQLPRGRDKRPVASRE